MVDATEFITPHKKLMQSLHSLNLHIASYMAFDTLQQKVITLALKLREMKHKQKENILMLSHQTLLPLISKFLIGGCLVSVALIAEDDTTNTPHQTPQTEENQDPIHIEPGTRAMSQMERIAIQEVRAARAQSCKHDHHEDCEEECESKGKEPKSSEDSNKQEAPDASITNAKASASALFAGVKASTVYFTTHEGAWHHPVSVSLIGDTLEIEDGSIWGVYSGDMHKTLNWLTGDLIIITPNHEWFSIYDYKVINLNTGAVVRVNLKLGPFYNGVYTHWIVGIDYYRREVLLEDGSLWSVSNWDQSIVNKWILNDTVIIGINDGFLSGSNPNIMINVNVLNYAIGRCLN